MWTYGPICPYKTTPAEECFYPYANIKSLTNRQTSSRFIYKATAQLSLSTGTSPVSKCFT